MGSSAASSKSNAAMVLKTAGVLLKCLSALLLPFVWFRPAAACPKECNCVFTEVWCTGGRYPRLPGLPDSARALNWVDAEVSTFAVSDLSPRLTSATFHRLRTKEVDNSQSPPSNLTTLRIGGCCGDRFPNISGLTELKNFRYAVRCRTNASVALTTDLVHDDAGQGSQLSNDGSSFSVPGCCLTAVQPDVLRRVFRRFKVVDLIGNRLRELRLTASDKKMKIKELKVNANPRLSVLDLGRNLSLTLLSISRTDARLENISLNGNKVNSLDVEWGTQPFSVGDVCRRFPSLIVSNMRGRSSLNVTEVRECKEMVDLNIGDSGQTQIPDMRGMQNLFRFKAGNNRFRELDLSLFPKDIAHIGVMDCLISRVLISDCSGVKNLKHLELSGNRLDLLPTSVISCLSKETLVLSIARNPMRSVFRPLKEACGPPNIISQLNMTSVSKVQEVGELPGDFLACFGVRTFIAEDNRLRSLAAALAAIRRQRHHGQITGLHLGRNKFTKIHDLAFMGFGELTTLNLAYNRISSIADTAFDTLLRLTTLDLRGNKLVVVGHWLATLPLMKEVRLAGNNFYCGCREVQGWNSSESNFLNFDPRMEVSGLICSAPSVVKYSPILTAIREIEGIVCEENTTRNPKTTVLSRTELVIILSVVAVCLLILSVVLITFIIARKRKVSYSLVRKESIPMS